MKTKSDSTRSIPVPDELLSNLAKHPVTVEEFTKLAKKFFPAQWRIAVTCMQLGMTLEQTRTSRMRSDE